VRIHRVELERFDLELTEPYTIAYETISNASNFILKLETDLGLIGYGCAAPDPVITAEQPEDVEEAFKNQIEPALHGQNVFQYAHILEELKPNVRSSALAMVDLALFDLISKKADVPLYQYLGGYRHEIATSITIGIMPLTETLKKARSFVDDGFGIIKLKGGLDVEEDIEKIHALRKNQPKILLRFDGNQGYSLEEALHFVEQTRPAEIEIFEQPTTVKNEELMGVLSKKIHLPVMADESLKTLQDAFRLTSNDYTDMINIKLQKVGGIWEGLHINSVARSAKNEVMVGCLDECALGISAGLHFALSRPNIQYADLDAHLDFVSDPMKGLFTIKKGIMRPNNKPGLGYYS
jgi:L-alanine-DL-glutamate epimerase-like enolase superfamily enzyme